MSQIKNIIAQSIDTKTKLLNDNYFISKIQTCVDKITEALQSGNKLLFCGNGGSAADAQHLAAEFSGRFYIDRKALPAEALHVNTSYLTAVANDYSFDVVYSRMVEGIGNSGDILIRISTSGNSTNIIKALETTQSKKMTTIAMTGGTGGLMKDIADILLNIPSSDTPRNPRMSYHDRTHHLSIGGRKVFFTMIHEAVILAGGLGTRLRSAVPDLPKCMAPVAGKPFLDYVIQYLQNEGIQKFIISLGYMHEIVLNHLQKHWPEIQYTYTIEDEPLGTGGAIMLAAQKVQSEDFIVTNGDTLFLVDIDKMHHLHRQMNAFITIALKPMIDFDRYGSIDINTEYKIVSFKEKCPVQQGLINGGLYLISRNDLLKMDLPQVFSFEKNVLEPSVKQGNIYGKISDTYFIDIGIPEDFEKASQDLKVISNQSNF